MKPDNKQVNFHIIRPDKSVLHFLFQIGMWLKGIDAALEILGGALLAAVTPVQISSFFVFLTQHEVSHDPNDAVAQTILQLSRNISADAQNFASVYLMIHGAVKLVLVLFILRKKMWAFPIGIAFFAVFAVYEAYRFSYTGSLWLILFAGADFLLAFLTLREYWKIRSAAKEETD